MPQSFKIPHEQTRDYLQAYSSVAFVGGPLLDGNFNILFCMDGSTVTQETATLTSDDPNERNFLTTVAPEDQRIVRVEVANITMTQAAMTALAIAILQRFAPPPSEIPSPAPTGEIDVAS